MRLWSVSALLLALYTASCQAQEISKEKISVRAIRENRVYTGFKVLKDGVAAAVVRLSSNRLLAASRCVSGADGRSLVFKGLQARAGTGLKLGPQDSITVALKPNDPYPTVSFSLNILAFDPAKWQAKAGKEPFHFLTLSLPDAEAWHQRGWLNATPLADPFPLLLDRHVGSPEISAYHYNRNWSYTPPLGAHPIPVIGLWAPRSKHYVGFEFQTTRLEDNSERDVATGYRWAGGQGKSARRSKPDQFVALVYPYGGTGYQQLVFPKRGDRIASHGVLLWSLDLPSTDDPNRFFWGYLWERAKDRLPRVPPVVDLSWVPGGIRLRDFGGPASGSLIGGVEGGFQVPGSKVLGGWGWHNEGPAAAPKKRGDAARLQALEEEARQLLRYAKRFRYQGEECVFWEKPLEGAWTPEWGGKPATTLHNANGFAAGRLFLGLYRDLGRTEYLPIVDGVLNWAKYIAWTRNEFADVPSSPFAIGGTLSASFCLDYYMTFKDSPKERLRNQARRALDLARTFTYRYMTMWPSDNNRADNLDSAFLWEPNSGRDWTGAACANEVFWNLDTLAQTAVVTGDPVLMWALQGSLSRWHLLYQEVYKDSLPEYQPGDMTEGFGLYAGNVYGVGGRASYGFASPLFMAEPVGNSVVRVLAGEKAAMVFNKEGAHTGIFDYRYTPDGNLSFHLHSRLQRFDLSLTVPYVDISRQSVYIVRNGGTGPLHEGTDFSRPPQALWSLYIRNLRDDDQIIIGEPDINSPVLPSLIQGGDGLAPPPPGVTEVTPLPYDTSPEMSWDRLDSWAGLPRGELWAFGIPFVLAYQGEKSIVTKPFALEKPISSDAIALFYSADGGPLPAVVLDDGTRETVDTSYEAIAWRAWPPIYTARLLVAPVIVGGKAVTGIDPGGRAVWAMTALHLPGDRIARIMNALKEGASQWQQLQREEKAIRELKSEVAGVPEGSFAILPPRPGGPATSLILRAGLAKRGVMLTPEQSIDPAFFNARRFPAALYAGGEDYLHTVRAPGDAADTVVRYVREGGTLLLLSPGPFPMYYANGPGFHRAEPLTDRLGIPIYNAIETAPQDKLTVKMTPDQSFLPGLPPAFPYPPGDPRLRSIDRSRLPAGSRYTPICTIVGESGQNYGDAGGLVELPGGQGRILYLWGGLLRDPTHGSAITQAAVRFLIRAARKE